MSGFADDENWFRPMCKHGVADNEGPCEKCKIRGIERHNLKTLPQEFGEILNNRKRHEIRVNDRDFREGDELFLKEWDPKTETYTGRHVLVLVTYITPGGEWDIPSTHCVMSIKIQEWYNNSDI